MAKRGGYITTGERVRSYIGLAFVISIIVHLAIGSILPNFAKHNEQQGPEQVTVSRNASYRPHAAAADADSAADSDAAAATTPPPHSSSRWSSPSSRSTSSHTTSNSKSGSTETSVAQPKTGSENGAPQGQGNGTPAPAAAAGTPKPACANPNVEAIGHQSRSARLSGIGARSRTRRGHGRSGSHGWSERQSRLGEGL